MEWFEDEELWRDFYDTMFRPERFAAAEQETGQIIALTRSNGGAVLDLCCGPGRHSTSFAQRGFKVTGVDRSRFLLDRARERALTAGVEVEWVEQDMRRFSRPGAFDLACSLSTSFGYFEEEADNLCVLRNVHASLVPGGAFVIDVVGKEQLARIWQNVGCTRFGDRSLVVQRRHVYADWTRIRNEWILIEEGRAKSYTFDHALYSGRELKALLLESGFVKVCLFGNLEGTPYGLDASRLVALARKS
jgi:SAM-dependent methyltransferase